MNLFLVNTNYMEPYLSPSEVPHLGEAPFAHEFKFYLRYTVETYMGALTGDANEKIVRHAIDIIARNETYDPKKKAFITHPDEIVGHLMVTLVDVFAEASAPYFIVDESADWQSGFEPEDAVEFFDFEQSDYTKAFQKLTKDSLEPFAPWLIFNYIEIVPNWRGKGLALSAMKAVILTLGRGCSLMLLKVFPPQFQPDQNQAGLEAFSTDEAKAVQRLTWYYGRLDFQPVKSGSRILFLNPNQRNPAFEDWVGPY